MPKQDTFGSSIYSGTYCECGHAFGYHDSYDDGAPQGEKGCTAVLYVDGSICTCGRFEFDFEQTLRNGGECFPGDLYAQLARDTLQGRLELHEYDYDRLCRFLDGVDPASFLARAIDDLEALWEEAEEEHDNTVPSHARPE